MDVARTGNPCRNSPLWQRLTDGGQEGQCGWLTDRFGVSWQIVPAELPDLLSGEDTAASQRAVEALVGMTKLDIATLRKAYGGE